MARKGAIVANVATGALCCALLLGGGAAWAAGSAEAEDARATAAGYEAQAAASEGSEGATAEEVASSAEAAQEAAARAARLQTGYIDCDDDELERRSEELGALFPGTDKARTPWAETGTWAEGVVTDAAPDGSVSVCWLCTGDDGGAVAVVTAVWDPASEAFGSWELREARTGEADADTEAAGAVMELVEKVQGQTEVEDDDRSATDEELDAYAAMRSAANKAADTGEEA